MSCRKSSPADLVPQAKNGNGALVESVPLCQIRPPFPPLKMAGTVDGCTDYIRCDRRFDCKGEMSEDAHHESSLDDDILEEAIKYIIAASKGNQYKYTEGWDKNMKRSARKRADRVIMREWM